LDPEVYVAEAATPPSRVFFGLLYGIITANFIYGINTAFVLKLVSMNRNLVL
jgi:hypothetical protein